MRFVTIFVVIILILYMISVFILILNHKYKDNYRVAVLIYLSTAIVWCYIVYSNWMTRSSKMDYLLVAGGAFVAVASAVKCLQILLSRQRNGKDTV